AHGAGKGAMNPSLNRLAVTPDGKLIMSAGQTTAPREQTKIEWGPKNVTLSQVRFWDLKTGRRTATVYGEEDYGFGHAAFSPDAQAVVVAGSKDDRTAYRNGLIVVCDGATGKTLREITLKQIRNGALGRDGKTVVAATNFGGIGETRLHAFDVATGRGIF